MSVSSVTAATPVPCADRRQAPASASESDFATVLAATQSADTVGGTIDPTALAAEAGGVLVDTSAGKQTIEPGNYFTPQSERGANSFHSLPPLLLPSPDNVQALSSDASAKLKGILAESNIPAAPAKITFDAFGQMQLPSDYAYADQFKQAMAESPAVERELSTANALASQYAAMQPSLSYIREYEAAGSQAAADAVTAKYSDLFNAQRPVPKIELDFTSDGKLTVTADGKPLRTG